MANGKQVKAEQCWRCGGTGIYVWGAIVNGKPTHQGPCFKCVGGGEFPATQGAILWRQQTARARRAARVAAEAAKLTEAEKDARNEEAADVFGIAEFDRVQST